MIRVILTKLVPAQSARGRALHTHALAPLALGIERYGLTLEGRDLWHWSNVRHMPGPVEGLSRRAIDRAGEFFSGVADRWATEADARDHARREQGS